MPIPTRLDLRLDGALPASVEATAYFLLAEALTNAVKHAHAKTLDVRVARADGTLHIEVADDGVGGAAAGTRARAAGHGRPRRRARRPAVGE